MVRWHKSDLLNRMYCNLEDGRKIAMPRYFKLKLYTDEEREAIAYSSKVLIDARNEVLIAKYGDDLIRMNQELIIFSLQKMYKDAEKERGLL